MNEHIKPIPDGYSAVTPYLCVKGAAAAIELCKQAFGAQDEIERRGAALFGA